MVDFGEDEAFWRYGDSVMLEEGLAGNALFEFHVNTFRFRPRDGNVMSHQSPARICGSICIAK